MAVFQCQHESADIIGWRINQSHRLPSNSSGYSENLADGGIVYMLAVVALSEYNETAIRCVAISHHGDQEQVSPVAYMFVQGDNE